MNLKFTIDRFEGDQAVLKSDDNNTIVWPKNKLPANTHEGMILVFDILEAKEKENLDKKRAKDILNEILNTNQ